MSRLYFLDVSRVYVEAPVIRDRHRVLPLPLHEKKKDGKKEEKYADIMLIILIYYSVND